MKSLRWIIIKKYQEKQQTFIPGFKCPNKNSYLNSFVRKSTVVYQKKSHEMLKWMKSQS